MIDNIDILKNVTILYAEDEADLRDVTSSILKSFTNVNRLIEITKFVFGSPITIHHDSSFGSG